jgi:osmotically inducible lipoprotein OsmB
MNNSGTRTAHEWRDVFMQGEGMNRTIRVLLLTSLLGVSACSTPPTNKQVGATAGAVIGGVVGSALTGGSTAGTVAGAGAGAAVGYEIGKRVK